MQKIVNHPVFGEIVYEENLWTGKKSLSVNGRDLRKKDKNTFVFQEGEEIIMASLRGNTLSGVSLHIQKETIWIHTKPAWYDWILALLPLVLNLIWGNSVQLCSIIPVVGGAIGGALNGMAVVLIMASLRGKGVGGKLLTALVGTLAAFGVCAVLGYAILGTMVA